MIKSNRFSLNVILVCTGVVVLSLAFFDTDVATLVQANSSRGLGNIYLRAEVDAAIRKVQILEGDVVPANKVLITFNDDETKAELSKQRLDHALALAMAGFASGAFPTKNLPAIFLTEPFAAVYSRELDADRSRRTLFDSKMQLTQAKMDASQKEIATIKPRLDILEQSNFIQAKELDAMAKLVEQGLEPNSELRKAQQSKLNLENQWQELLAKQTSLTSDFFRLTLERQQLKSEFESMLSDDAAAFSADALRFSELVANIESRLRKYQVVSSVPGRVTKLAHLNPGEAFRAGEVLVELAPSEGAVLFEGKVNPKDISKVRQGMPAKVVILTYNRYEVKPLTGHVSFVSPSAMTDKDGNEFYVVRVTPSEQEVSTFKGMEPLGLGLSAEVSISAGKRSVLSFLLSPLLQESEKIFRER
jgi:HlyD family type I secretion membrane fusion protein